MYYDLLNVSYSRIRNGIYPRNWPKELKGKGFTRIKVTGTTYNNIASQFHASMNGTVNIVSIEEVCNIDEYEKYKRYLVVI